jgi:hypothetical protein
MLNVRELNSLRKELQNKRIRITRLKEAQRNGVGLKEFLQKEIEEVGFDKYVQKGKIFLILNFNWTVLDLPPHFHLYSLQSRLHLNIRHFY